MSEEISSDILTVREKCRWKFPFNFPFIFFFFYETSGKVHGNFHVPCNKFRGKEISVYLATKFRARYFRVKKHMAKCIQIYLVIPINEHFLI